MRKKKKKITIITASEAIVFTTLADRIEPGQNIIPDEAASFRVPAAARGIWGGVIILGDAFHCSLLNENIVEGIPENASVSGVNGDLVIDRTYGPISGFGNNGDINGNSGSLRYVSIRHGGTSLGPITDANEINGLTMAGVGKGTQVNFVETFAIRDDGFQFVGGAFDSKYLIASFCGDDHFDMEKCFVGNGQYWVSWQDNATGDLAADVDGNDGIFTSYPVVANATFSGYFIDFLGTVVGSSAIDLGDAAGFWVGSVFSVHKNEVNYDGATFPLSSAFTDCVFEDFFGTPPPNLAIKNLGSVPADNIKHSLNGPCIVSSPDCVSPISNATLSFSTVRNAITQGGLCIQPFLINRANSVDLSFFDDVTYRGAFDPSAALWTNGWTAWEKYYKLSNLPGGPITDITD